MPRRLVTEVDADTSNFKRNMSSASHSTKLFGRELGRSSRGALAASGIFRGMGRSVAFASGAFLGAAGSIEVIKSVIDAAKNIQATIAQTKVVVENGGQSWNKYAGSIEKTAIKLSQLSGESHGAILESFQTLYTRTNDVGSAMRLTALATDIARARHIDLASASKLVIKASLGLSGMLRRVGIAAKEGSTPLQLLTLLQEKYGGSAAAFGKTAAGATARFSNAIELLKESLGEKLIPVMTEYLNKGTAWLMTGKNQAKVVDIIVQSVKYFIHGMKIALSAIKAVFHGLEWIKKELGSWRAVMHVVIGLWLGWKIYAIGAAVAVQIANIQAALGVKEAWTAALITTGWGIVAVAAGLAAEYILTHWQKVKGWFAFFWAWLIDEALHTARKMVEPFSHLPSFLGGWARHAKDSLNAMIDANQKVAAEIEREGGKSGGKTAKNFGKSFEEKLAKMGLDIKLNGKLPKFKPDAGKSGISTWAQKMLDTLQLHIDQAGLTATLKDDLVAQQALTAFIEKQVSLHKGDLTWQQKLVASKQQQLQLEQQIAAQQLAARNARQYKYLGLDAQGNALAPTVKGLKKELKHVGDAVKGTFLDTRHTQSLLARITKLLAGGLGKLSAEVRSKIKELLDGLDQDLKNRSGGDVTAFRHVYSKKILGGVGLTTAQMRALRTRIAQIGPNGYVPGHHSQAYAGAHGGGGVAINGPIYITGIKDLRAFEDEILRRARSRSHSRRGH